MMYTYKLLTECPSSHNTIIKIVNYEAGTELEAVNAIITDTNASGLLILSLKSLMPVPVRKAHKQTVIDKVILAIIDVTVNILYALAQILKLITIPIKSIVILMIIIWNCPFMLLTVDVVLVLVILMVVILK